MPGRHRAYWRVNKTVFDEVCVLWAEHMGLTFPDDLRGVEIYDQPVAYLDFCIAGPMTSYVGSQRGCAGHRSASDREGVRWRSASAPSSSAPT
mgnify:CR=1 FL=1